MSDLLKPITAEYINPVEQRRNAIKTFSHELLTKLGERSFIFKGMTNYLQQKISTFLSTGDEESLMLDTRTQEFPYLADVAHIAEFYTNHPEVEIPEEIIVTPLSQSFIDTNELGLQGITKFLFVLPGNGAKGINMTIDAKCSDVYLGGEIEDFNYIRGRIRGANTVLVGRKMARTNIPYAKTVALIGGDFWLSHGEADPYGWSGEINAKRVVMDRGNIYAKPVRSDTTRHDLHTQISCQQFIMGNNAGNVGENAFINTDHFIKQGGEFHGWFGYNGDEESLVDFQSQGAAYKEDKENNSSVYSLDLGKASAFIVRPKEQLTLKEYITLLKKLNESGALAFGRNEGTEIGGFFMQPASVLQVMNTLQDSCDVAIGIPTKGSSCVEWSWDANIANYGCEALVAAGRGLHTLGEKNQLPVWQLIPSDENSDEVIEGYKATQLRNPSIHESIQIARSVAPQVHEIIQTVNEASIIREDKFEKLYVVKVDINDYTKTLLSLDKNGQEKFLQKTSTFLLTLENRLREYTKQEGSGKIFFGDHTDALTFYLINLHTMREVQNMLKTLLAEQESSDQPLAFKTVGILRKNVQVAFAKKNEGDVERLIYSKQPISDSEWAEKEKIVKERGLESDKIFFEEG